MRIGPPDTISEAHMFRMYLLIMKKKCFLMLICLWCQRKCLHSAYLFQANSGPNSNGCQVSAPKKKKLNHFINESFVPIEYFSNIYFYLVIIFLCIFFCQVFVHLMAG